MNDEDSFIIGRESELYKMKKLLSQNIETVCPLSLYISGPPGTGKTACTRYTLRSLRQDKNLKFIEIYVNCMEIRTAGRIYRYVFDKITETKGANHRKPLVPVRKLPETLEAELTGRRKEMIIIVLDEIDQLETKNRDVLYTTFRWPTLPSSRVILIGIANSLDLTKRLLPKLNLNGKHTPIQMQFSFLLMRLWCEVALGLIAKLATTTMLLDTNDIDSSAVELCARKVSAITGDIRKAMDICRMSLDQTPTRSHRSLTPAQTQRFAKAKRGLAEVQEGEIRSPKVSCKDVLDTVRDVYGSKMERLNFSLPIQQKLILSSALALSQRGKKQFPLSKLISAYRKACVASKVMPMESSECSNLCELLESQGLLSLGLSKGFQTPQVHLLVDLQSAREALNDEALVRTVMKTILS